MIKSLSSLAMIVSLSSVNATAHSYVGLLPKDMHKDNSYKKSSKLFSLTEKEKSHLITINSENMEFLSKYQAKNEEVFTINFERWIVEESATVSDLVEKILSMSKEFEKGFKREAKYYKGYPSIANKLEATASKWNEIYRFTLQFKQRADDAKQVNAFMNDFIPANKEVLEALA